MMLRLFTLSLAAAATIAAPAFAAERISNCSYKGKPLFGKVQVVTSFPDLKVKLVESFPDLKVQKVTSFPDRCGKWEIVTSFPDFTVQYVKSFPDFTVKFVEIFTGTEKRVCTGGMRAGVHRAQSQTP